MLLTSATRMILSLSVVWALLFANRIAASSGNLFTTTISCPRASFLMPPPPSSSAHLLFWAV
ncbi:hypothetical protein ECANGB1_2642 [Enterospora canceri]|uniref:Secreted protein n=1 Tax=Enterospora canceri TaxID=1081671 RepID=A0A1Y1S999_9MICR|nr:hypothetical protein ECANGB1_2642 [Enterospora canceri]